MGSRNNIYDYYTVFFSTHSAIKLGKWFSLASLINLYNGKNILIIIIN